MDFPCAASSCMLFTVPLLIMAAISCVDENNISHKSTALLGVGQIFYYCSPVNYNLLLTMEPVQTLLARTLDHLHRTQCGGRPVSLSTSDRRFRSSGHVHAAVSHGLLYASGFSLGRTH